MRPVASKSASARSGEWPWPVSALAVVISASDMAYSSPINARSVPLGKGGVPARPSQYPAKAPGGNQPSFKKYYHKDFAPWKPACPPSFLAKRSPEAEDELTRRGDQGVRRGGGAGSPVADAGRGSGHAARRGLGGGKTVSLDR